MKAKLVDQTSLWGDDEICGGDDKNTRGIWPSWPPLTIPEWGDWIFGQQDLVPIADRIVGLLWSLGLAW